MDGKWMVGRLISYPKDHWTLKTGYFEDPTPALGSKQKTLHPSKRVFARLGYSIATYFRFASSGSEKQVPMVSQDPGVDSHLPHDVLFCCFQAGDISYRYIIIRIDPEEKQKNNNNNDNNNNNQIHTSLQTCTSTLQGVVFEP